MLRLATKSRKSQIKFGDNSRAARVLRSQTHEIEHKMTTYSKSFEGRLLQSPSERGVQSRVFGWARAHPRDVFLMWSLNPFMCHCSVLLQISDFWWELDKYHLPYQAAGINCCTKVGIVYTRTVHSGSRGANRFCVCTLTVHSSNGVTTLPSTFIK